MQRGSMVLAFGFFSLVAGVLALKLTDLNMYWLVIALGAAVGIYGAIQVSKRARP